MARATHPASISRPTPTPGRAVSLPMIASPRTPRSTKACTTGVAVPTPIKPPNITLAPSGIRTAASAAEIARRIAGSAEDMIAAVDIDRVSRHRAGVLACQKDARGADLLDGHQTPGRRTFRHSLHQRIEIGNSGGGADRQGAGTDGMHTNPLRSELRRQVAHG